MNIVKNLVSESKYGLKCPYTMKPEYITVHNTANDASARNEINYMINNSYETSFHLAVDDKEAVQGLPLDRNGWHAGDGGNGTGNRKSIGIEICYSKGGGARFTKAEENAAELIAQLLKQYGWGIDRVKKHQDWSNKYCPHRTLDLGWDRFIKMIEAKLEAEKYTLVTEVPVYMSAKDASNSKNSVKKYPAGEYYVFNKSNGMINITKTKGKAGGWINPKDNVKPPKVEIVKPKEENTNNIPDYFKNKERRNALLWLLETIYNFLKKLFK